jgi:choline-sulfatase
MPAYDHIVLISLDTLRSDCIAANPYKLWPEKHRIAHDLATPRLDSLAAEGAFFPNCITAAPYTSAAHASIFTGKWPLRHGLFEAFNRKLRGKTIFSRARSRGYDTFLKVDFPIILGPHLGFDRDIDRYLIEQDDAFLDLVAGSRRSVSCAHFGGLHIPYGFHNLDFGGRAYEEKVRELEERFPDRGGEPVDRLVESYRGSRDLELLVRYKRIIQRLYNDAAYDELFRLYLEGISFFLENRFNRFLDRLFTVLSGKRFLLVLFGDHGEEYDREAYGHYNSLAEGVLRVPLIFFGDDVVPGRHDGRIRTVDITPTLLEALGESPRVLRGLDGESLGKAVWKGEGTSGRIAFAQAYIPETARFVEFQKKLLSTGRKEGRLEHFLFQEAVYIDSWKLTRQNYRYGKDRAFGGIERAETQTRLERVGDGLRIVPASDPVTEARLGEELDRYNQLRRAGPR